MKTIEFFVVFEAWLFLFPDRHPFTCRQALEKTEGTIKNGQIQRNWQHWVQKTQDEDKKKQNNTEN